MSAKTWSTGVQDTIVAVLSRAIASHPEREFLDFTGLKFTYGDIDRESTRLARGLADLGVAFGDTVGVVLDNNVDAVLTWLAINKLGAIFVPVNTAYKGEFLRHQLADAGVKVIVAESDYAGRILEVESGLPEAQHLIHRGPAPAASAERLSVRALDSIRSTDTSPIEAEVLPSTLAMLIYTAGTTGPSKGCMISHNYACNLARQTVNSTGRTADDVNWTALPLFHLNAVSSTVIATMMVGARASIYPRFSLSNFWPEIERSGATIASLLGSMMPLIGEAADTEASKRCFGQIKHVRGAPFPATLQQKWKDRFGILTAGTMAYGLTEASVVTSLDVGDTPPPGSSGHRNNDFDVRIVDEFDNELPPEESGEIIVRPLRPHVMYEGYWRRPQDSMNVMRNMWFHTGDIGKFDAEGYFYFMDRKKDYVRRRGENISSFEMETSFRAHAGIEDVAIHSVFSEMGEDDVKVTCVLKADAALTEEELCLWAIDRIPYFAIPRYIEFRSELPKNPVGRVLKYQLRDEGCTPATWDREKAGIELKKR